MKFNIIYNEKISDYKISLEKIEKIFIQRNIKFKTFELNQMSDYGDFSVVIGGDGTLLKAAKFYSANKVPVLGINIGRLGFLSQSDINEFADTVEKIMSNEYFVEERLLLKYKNYTALNDFVIKGASASRTAKFYLEINNEVVCDYIADGLIISTPTGSTAYCLSAGGPVVSPNIEAIVIVPICPHTLNARPIVVSSSEKIVVKTEDELLSIFADGNKIQSNVDTISIKAAEQKAGFAFLKRSNFYSVIRNKLHWGVPSGSAEIVFK